MNSSPRPTTARQRRLAIRAARQRRVLLAITACFALILLMFVVLLVGNVISRFVDDAPEQPDDPSSQTPEEPTTPEQPEQPDYGPDTTFVLAVEDNMRRGDLILVNLSHEYIFPAINSSLVNVYDSQSLSGTLGDHFQLSGSALLLDKAAYNALDRMMRAFYEATANSNVIITSAYRSYADQEGKSVPPGFSDSHTGLSFALRVLTAAGHTADLSSDPVYEWIYNNCYRFGFVVRYPAGKEALTEVSDYDYYFRYVGYVHAYVMQINDMCLEEYIPYVQGYSKKEPLRVTADDGVSYEIYYVPATAGGETSLPVPTDHPYTVSGDNERGFVVTVTCIEQ